MDPADEIFCFFPFHLILFMHLACLKVQPWHVVYYLRSYTVLGHFELTRSQNILITFHYYCESGSWVHVSLHTEPDRDADPGPGSKKLLERNNLSQICMENNRFCFCFYRIYFKVLMKTNLKSTDFVFIRWCVPSAIYLSWVMTHNGSVKICAWCSKLVSFS